MSEVSEMTKCFLCLNTLHLGIDSISPDIDLKKCYSSQQLTLFGEMTFLEHIPKKGGRSACETH